MPMKDLKPGEVELWIRTDTGLWLVMPDLQEYDLSKPMARTEVIDELQRCIKIDGGAK